MAGRYFTGHRSCKGRGVAQAELTTARPERRPEAAFRLPVQILPQPDETTCGPTCLHAVFRYFGEDVPLKRIIDRGERLMGAVHPTPVAAPEASVAPVHFGPL